METERISKNQFRRASKKFQLSSSYKKKEKGQMGFAAHSENLILSPSYKKASVMDK
jgi:hypothetical protein